MRDNPKAEQWTIIDLPALAEPSKSDAFTRSSTLSDDNAETPEGVTLTKTPEDDASPRSVLDSPSRRGRVVDSTDTREARAYGFDSVWDFWDAQDRALEELRNPPQTSETSQTDWTDVLGRKLGEALCPEWFDEAELAEIKRRMGTYSFLSMYQQRPVPAEGALFKKAWFQIVDRAPSSTRWKRGYDLGLSGKPGCDFTATAKIGYDHDGNLYIDGVIRKRMEYPEQRRVILGLIRAEPNIEHIIEESANGHAVLQDLRREPELRATHLRGVRVKENKIGRTFAWSALAEAGKVFLVEGRWVQDFIEEACSFPSGTHDDQIDAVSLAVKIFAERGRRNAWGC